MKTLSGICILWLGFLVASFNAFPSSLTLQALEQNDKKNPLSALSSTIGPIAGTISRRGYVDKNNLDWRLQQDLSDTDALSTSEVSPGDQFVQPGYWSEMIGSYNYMDETEQISPDTGVLDIEQQPDYIMPSSYDESYASQMPMSLLGELMGIEKSMYDSEPQLENKWSELNELLGQEWYSPDPSVETYEMPTASGQTIEWAGPETTVYNTQTDSWQDEWLENLLLSNPSVESYEPLADVDTNYPHPDYNDASYNSEIEEQNELLGQEWYSPDSIVETHEMPTATEQTIEWAGPETTVHETDTDSWQDEGLENSLLPNPSVESYEPLADVDTNYPQSDYSDVLFGSELGELNELLGQEWYSPDPSVETYEMPTASEQTIEWAGPETTDYDTQTSSWGNEWLENFLLPNLAEESYEPLAVTDATYSYPDYGDMLFGSELGEMADLLGQEWYSPDPITETYDAPTASEQTVQWPSLEGGNWVNQWTNSWVSSIPSIESYEPSTVVSIDYSVPASDNLISSPSEGDMIENTFSETDDLENHMSVETDSDVSSNTEESSNSETILLSEEDPENGKEEVTPENDLKLPEEEISNDMQDEKTSDTVTTEEGTEEEEIEETKNEEENNEEKNEEEQNEEELADSADVTTAEDESSEATDESPETSTEDDTQEEEDDDSEGDSEETDEENTSGITIKVDMGTEQTEKGKANSNEGDSSAGEEDSTDDE